MKLTQVVKVEGNYEILNNLAKITNGLYNSALYEINQRYKKEQKFYFYYDLCNILKGNTLSPYCPPRPPRPCCRKSTAQ